MRLRSTNAPVIRGTFHNVAEARRPSLVGFSHFLHPCRSNVTFMPVRDMSGGSDVLLHNRGRVGGERPSLARPHLGIVEAVPAGAGVDVSRSQFLRP
jgi:hypothetical protein